MERLRGGPRGGGGGGGRQVEAQHWNRKVALIFKEEKKESWVDGGRMVTLRTPLLGAGGCRQVTWITVVKKFIFIKYDHNFLKVSTYFLLS